MRTLPLSALIHLKIPHENRRRHVPGNWDRFALRRSARDLLAFRSSNLFAPVLTAQHQHEVENTPESGSRVTFAVIIVTAL